MAPKRDDKRVVPIENDPVPEDQAQEDRVPEDRVPEDRVPGGRRGENWTFPFHADLDAVAPALLRSQNAWLAQIDSLSAPDRKTHELIRMVCSVIARNPHGIRRHAMLAAEVGASWEEVAGSVILAEPAFGILVAVEALPWARKGWERGSSMGDEEEPG
jgi:Carboxymuconolactone decarboxylase family